MTAPSSVQPVKPLQRVSVRNWIFQGLRRGAIKVNKDRNLTNFLQQRPVNVAKLAILAPYQCKALRGDGRNPPCFWRGCGHKSLHHRLRHPPPQYGCCSAIDPKTNQSMPYTSRVNSLSSTSARAASALFANMTSDCALKATKSGSTRAPSNRPTESVGS